MGTLRDAIDAVVPVIEAAGGVIIVAGAAWAFLHVLMLTVRRSFRESFTTTRLDLGRVLVLAL